MAIKERCSAQIFKSEIGSPPQKKMQRKQRWMDGGAKQDTGSGIGKRR